MVRTAKWAWIILLIILFMGLHVNPTAIRLLRLLMPPVKGISSG